MESIIKDILCSSLLAAGRISKHQHAFMTKHSTTTNLLESTYDWTVSLNNPNPVDILYIDFSKALTLSYIVSSFLNYAKSVSLTYSFHGLPLFWQTDSNNLELKTSSRISQQSLVVSHMGQSLDLFFLYSSLMTLNMFFLIKHLLNYLLTIPKYTQPLIFRRLIIFSKLLIYCVLCQKAGSFQSIFLKLDCYILVRLLMYIRTSLMALPSHLQTKFGILVSSRIVT